MSSQVSAGRDYTCGVRPPGTLECWGGTRIPAFRACGGDSDGDGIPDDGDGSGVAGDAPCAGGNTSSCDDNCPAVYNPSQADGENDGVGDACDSCPAVVNLGDGDADGIDDACDICFAASAASTMRKPVLLLGNLLAPLGDETLVLKGVFETFSAFAPVLDPLNNGMEIAVWPQSYSSTLDLAGRTTIRIPAGAWNGVRGWQVDRTRTTWVYADKTKPPAANGVFRISVREVSTRTARRIEVVVKGASGTYPAGPYYVAVALNDTAGGGALGQCGEFQFGATRCVLLPSGKKAKCR